MSSYYCKLNECFCMHAMNKFDQPHNIWLREEITYYFIQQFFHPPVTSSVLAPDILLSNLFTNVVNLFCSLM